MSTPSTSLVSDFITSTLNQIQSSIPPNARIDESIRFEITTVSQQGKGGKVNASVLNFGTNIGMDISENQTQKVSFAIKFPTDAEIATDAAIKAKAEADKIENEVTKKRIIDSEKGFLGRI